MTENLIMAPLSMKSVKEMRAHLKVRKKGKETWKREEGGDLNEIREAKKQRSALEDCFFTMESYYSVSWVLLEMFL